MARVVWTTPARDDVDAIRRFIGRQSPVAAALIAQRILRSTKRLADFPESGRLLPEADDVSIREIIVGRYRVVYRVHRSEVRIALVLDAARLLDLDELRRRL